MRADDAAGMEMHAFCVFHAFDIFDPATIFAIAEDGATHHLRVHADLVHAAGARPEGNKSGFAADAVDDRIFRTGPFALFFIDQHFFFTRTPALDERGLDRTLRHR